MSLIFPIRKALGPLPKIAEKIPVPQFHFIKVGFKGVYFSWICFRDEVRHLSIHRVNILATLLAHSFFNKLFAMFELSVKSRMDFHRNRKMRH